METKTTIVVGAGASKEVGLPTGFELKNEISGLLDIRFHRYSQISGDGSITQALRALVREDDGTNGDIKPYLHEAWHIRDVLPMAISIDNLLDTQRNNEKIAICGKLAIARAILSAEKNSRLYFEGNDPNESIDFIGLEGTWYLSFFQLLTENCDKADLAERLNSIALIVFNYDRCIEHFLYNALQKYYRLSADEAAQLVINMNIYHPYGSVGVLPWQEQKEGLPYGGIPNAERLLEVAQKLKTFTEGTDISSSDILGIKSHVQDASRLVFIGFAFHRLNMKLISPDESGILQGLPECYATTLGISESDKRVLQKQVNTLYGDTIETQMVNLSCADFFSEFWRSLSLSE